MKKIKCFLATVFFILVLANVLIAIHCYSFTHYTDNSPTKETVAHPTKGQIAKFIFTGINLPKNKKMQLPTQVYSDIRIAINNTDTLASWLIKTDSAKHGIVLVFHGYIDNKSSMLDRSDNLLKLGYDVLLVDFMASGTSTGRQTTMGYLEAENVKQAYDYVKAELKEDNIILLGFSMGAAAITKAQYDYKMDVKGIILEASFATFEGTIQSRVDQMNLARQPITFLITFWMGATNGFNGFSFQPIQYVKTLDVPTLLMCGLKDSNIPQAESELLFDAVASESKQIKLFENSTHESYLKHHEQEWIESTSLFLDSLK